MPSRANVLGSIAAAVAVFLLFGFWLHWPGFIAFGAGAIFGVAFLIVATSLGDDPRAADEAWRAAAPDLVGTATGSAPGRDENVEISPDVDDRAGG
jgi:hypothetical protein